MLRQTMLVVMLGMLVLAAGACGQSTDPLTPTQTGVEREVMYMTDVQCGYAEVDLVGCENDTFGEVIGKVIVTNDGTNLGVHFTITADGWQLEETHVAVGTSLDDFPVTKTGNPIIGQFDYSIEDAIPLADVDPDWQSGDVLYIAAHANAHLFEDDEIVHGESAWGEGTEFNTNTGSWASYFTYEVIDCCWVEVDLPDDPDDPEVQVTASHVHPGSLGGYWATTLSNVDSGYDVDNTSYTGWCVETELTMWPSVIHNVTLRSSYDEDLPDYASDGIYWPQINYILNNKPDGANYTQIQNAIWYFTGDFNRPDEEGLVQDLIDDAIANGGDFHPGYGDVYAVICDNSTTNNVRQQLTIIEVNPCD